MVICSRILVVGVSAVLALVGGCKSDAYNAQLSMVTRETVDAF